MIKDIIKNPYYDDSKLLLPEYNKLFTKWFGKKT